MSREPLAALLLLALVGTSCTSVRAEPPVAATTTTTATVAPIEQFDVIIGERSIFMECRGEPTDAPTVVIDAWSSGAVDALIRAVSAFTRACTYDHAGRGQSDPPPELPRSSEAYAADLHALLAGSGVGGPYVFVPWSANAWTAILYAATYPGEMVGMVMIDPRGPSVSDGHLAALPDPATDEPISVTDTRDFLLGLVSDPGGNDDERLDWHTSEALASAALDENGPLFGDLPLIVLSGGDTRDEWLGDLPETIADQFWEIWLADQQRLAGESTRGEWRVVADSRHTIHQDQPAAVIDAIREVVIAAR